MYDASKLKTVVECRTVMQRARARHLPEVYEAAFRRMCQLVGAEKDDPNDPLIKDFYETLGAYEQLLTEKNGRVTLASRTRQR
jgi:predicted site-specific integrase-resolvase